jgi:hypothetical protein
MSKHGATVVKMKMLRFPKNYENRTGSLYSYRHFKKLIVLSEPVGTRTTTRHTGLFMLGLYIKELDSSPLHTTGPAPGPTETPGDTAYWILDYDKSESSAWKEKLDRIAIADN